MEKGKKDTAVIGKLVAAFVSIMIAVVLISQIVVTGNAVTALQPGTEIVSIAGSRVGLGWINNSISYAPAFLNLTQTDSWRASIGDCAVGSIAATVVITNASGSVLTPTTDYTINATGYIVFENTEAVNNSNSNITTLAYNTCPTGYVYGWAATMLNLVYGIFALAALGIAIALFYSIARDYGII